MTKLYKTLFSAGWSDAHPFHELAEQVVGVSSPNELKDGHESALVVWGGADINPAFYNHPQSRTTYPGGKRDVIEWDLMNKAKELGMPLIGICRGAQMLCALAGGYLLQDVNGHHGRHTIKTFNDEIIAVNSIHHQMKKAQKGKI